MPRDATDTLMLKVLAGLAVLGGAVYFYPFTWPAQGYQGETEAVQQARETLEPILEEYGKYYPPPPRSVLDPDNVEEVIQRVGVKMAARKRAYEAEIVQLKTRIAGKQGVTRMNFVKWTEVPPEEEREPGFYFQRTWDKLRLELVDTARRANVDLVDQDIGFKKISGDVRMPQEKARMWLRELFIAQAVINLCINAKLKQEEQERSENKKLEAYMRILSATPEDPVQIGAYSRTPNPQYDPSERNPKSERYQKYITREWRKFIQMYPVRILLQCDINSFRHFLKSVRSQGQFLVIRNLEIVSPYLKESRKDTTEFQRLSGERGTKVADYKEEHVWVELSAAGMDFITPAKTERTVRPVGPASEGKGHKAVLPSGH